MFRKFVSMAVGVLLLLAVTALANAPQFERINTALEEGRIDAEQALLYKFNYVFDLDKLPVDLRPDEIMPIKSATRLVDTFERSRGELNQFTVEIIESYLAPEGGDKATYISPSGRFRLTYFTTGSNAVPAADVNPPNGIPDFVERCAEYLDYSWQVEITDLGFVAPPLNPYYEIGFESMSAYGYCVVVSGTRTRIVLHNNFIGFPPNTDPDGNQLGAAKVTCAHEFKHASQRPTSGWSEGGWVEVDATWVEDIVFDATNDYYNYIASGSGISHPHLSLDHGGTGSYEDCIWQHWMSETFGNQIIVDFWTHRSSNTGQAVMLSYNAILQAYGSSVALGFPRYAAWNYATGARSIPGIGYGEAAAYPSSAVWTANTYPYTSTSTTNHLAARNINCLGFVAGEPGTFRVEFNGDNTATMGLVAVIKKRDGTGLIETISLNASNDADVELSVPLAEIERAGIVISNAGITGDNKTWSLTLSKVISEPDPDPVVQLSDASFAVTLDPGQTDTRHLTVTNIGDPGSVLDFTAQVMAEAPSMKAWRSAGLAGAGRSGADRSVPRELQTADSQVQPLGESGRYAGDCVLGNNNTGAIQGYYGEWWYGSESYATRINPADYVCGCNPGFNVRAVHMVLYLEPASAPQVRAHLASAGAPCTEPGTILATSAPITVSGIPSNGYYDIEIPCNFACQDMSGEYFLIFEFMNTAGPVGIPVDSSPAICVNYNDWGSGWVDTVDQYGFAGNWLIWADVDCCGVAQPEVTVIAPDGGEVLLASAPTLIEWNATVLSEVRIELSRNGGGNWETLLASTPNDGAESVVLGGPASQNSLVRVGSTDGLHTGVSDGPFWIYETVGWLSLHPDADSLGQGGATVIELSFDSAGLAPGVYTAYVVIVSNAGSSPDVVPVTLTVEDPVSSVGGAPDVFALRAVAPNPFNPMTTITFSLATTGHAKVDIIDVQGRLVRSLYAGELPAGERSLVWDGRDNAGRSVPSGAYFARLESGSQTATRKMILAR